MSKKSTTTSDSRLFGGRTVSALKFAALTVVCAALFQGCPRKEEPKEEGPAPILDRTKDPEYIKTLHERQAQQAEISARAGAVALELEAARAEDPESEKTKELEKRQKEIEVEAEKNRIVSAAVIRDRMLKERADREKAAREAKEKEEKDKK